MLVCTHTIIHGHTRCARRGGVRGEGGQPRSSVSPDQGPPAPPPLPPPNTHTHTQGPCHCSNMEASALLILQLIVIAAYFALQCTKLMDDLVGETDARGWVGVTPNVQVACFIVLIPTMLYIGYVLVSITCRWKTTLRQASKDAAASVNMATLKDDHFVVAVVKWSLYIVGLHSPYFYLCLFASEFTEFVFQVLALQVRRHSVNELKGTLTLLKAYVQPCIFAHTRMHSTMHTSRIRTYTHLLYHALGLQRGGCGNTLHLRVHRSDSPQRALSRSSLLERRAQRRGTPRGTSPAWSRDTSSSSRRRPLRQLLFDRATDSDDRFIPSNRKQCLWLMEWNVSESAY